MCYGIGGGGGDGGGDFDGGNYGLVRFKRFAKLVRFVNFKTGFCAICEFTSPLAPLQTGEGNNIVVVGCVGDWFLVKDIARFAAIAIAANWFVANDNRLRGDVVNVVNVKWELVTKVLRRFGMGWALQYLLFSGQFTVISSQKNFISPRWFLDWSGKHK
ncbi:MAG: hypothetical protein K8L97_07655 [Anaerolineae bacterium]|nr:hypothetical protein [Anaerolineae bacterium]